MADKTIQIDLVLPNHERRLFTFDHSPILIGRSREQCDLFVNSQQVAQMHLVVKQLKNGSFTITNLHRMSTALLDGRPLLPRTPHIWTPGQAITIGNLQLVLHEPALAASRASSWLVRVSKWGLALTLLAVLGLLVTRGDRSSLDSLLNLFTLLFSTVFVVHGLFTLTWMLSGWNDLGDSNKNRSPEDYEPPTFSFTALIPARHEEKVIKDTIEAVNRINYPEALKQTLILCRQDDVKTIARVRTTLAELNQSNFELVIFNTYPINKPHSLNQGLRRATNDVVAVFDAEDELHPDLYHIANTVMIRDDADVVQSGVQLMNHTSHWFSALNVLEYFFWFRSGLHFFSKVGDVTPLGGNTVFIKKNYLTQVGGWDENCLTEDADIGIKLALHGAKTRVVYDERHATQEETPASTAAFIRQRTRWAQGFLQIFSKGDWKRLPKLRQRLLACYILLTPIIQSILVVSLPVGLWIAFNAKLPVGIALLSFAPLYMLVIQFLTHIYGLVEFTRAYRLKFPLWLPLLVVLAYYPYQMLLAVAAIRALYRVALGQNNWEKTAHSNAHRQYQPEAGMP